MIKNRKAIIVGIKSTVLSKKEKLFLNKYKPWGVILFSRNLKKFKQIQKLIIDIKSMFKDNKYPILIDQEGGTINRLNKLIDTSILTAEFYGNLYKRDKKNYTNTPTKTDIDSVRSGSVSSYIRLVFTYQSTYQTC